MPDIHPISARNIVPAVVPVVETQPVHDHTPSESQQTLLTAQTIISKSLAAIPVLTSSLLSQALESLHREFLRLPGNIAAPMLEILSKMQSRQTPMTERAQFFSIRNDPASVSVLLQEFISMTNGNPVMSPANAAALQMIMLMERQLVINLHALAAGLPLRIFFPVPNEPHLDVAEFTYDNAGKSNNHLRHFSLKMDTKTIGEIAVTGAELDKRLHIGFHTQYVESVRRLMDNFPHLRSALEAQQFTVMGLTATMNKTPRNTQTEAISHISVTT